MFIHTVASDRTAFSLRLNNIHMHMCMCQVCVRAQLCLTLCDPTDCVAHQAPLSMEFSRQEYWSGLPFPSPGDLPNPVIEPEFSCVWQVDSLPVGNTCVCVCVCVCVNM